MCVRSRLQAQAGLEARLQQTRSSELSDRTRGAADHVVLILRLAVHHECAGLRAPDNEAKAAIQGDRAHVLCVDAKVDLNHP